MPPEVAVAFAAQVTLSRSLKIHTSKTVSPLAARNMQIFVAGQSVAYPCVSEKQRAGRTAVK